jgi:hypothetical protein
MMNNEHVYLLKGLGRDTGVDPLFPETRPKGKVASRQAP